MYPAGPFNLKQDDHDIVGFIVQEAWWGRRPWVGRPTSGGQRLRVREPQSAGGWVHEAWVHEAQSGSGKLRLQEVGFAGDPDL